jgi:hypothetical protein
MKELNRETIFLRGHDFGYIPRDASDIDTIFGEVVKETYQAAVTLEFYCEQQTGFEGEGDFFSKFGLDIRDEATFIVNKDRFTEVVANSYPSILKPREGDLMYYDLAKSLFEITHVEKEQPFYQRGVQVQWVLKAKKFEYNYDEMTSGISEVDDLNTKEDPYNDSDEIQTASDEFMNFDENDPFSNNDY